MIPYAMNPMGRSRNGGSGGVVPLTLTAVTAGATVQLNATGSPTVSGLQYRTSGGSWSSYTPGTTVTLANVGDYVQFQNTESTLSTSASNYVQFAMTGTVAGSGNIQSMLNYADACQAYCYYNMFRGCTGLTTAPELPATTLANRCYYGMFQGCTGLTTAPELPATTLATDCYSSMFYNCTGLTTAPELPATTLATTCYRNMFYGCTNINSVTVGLTSWDSTGYTNNWLSGVSATGTFTCPAGLTVPARNASGVPSGWTIARV